VTLLSVQVVVPNFLSGDDASNVTIRLQGQQSCPVLQQYLRWGVCAPFVVTPVDPPGPPVPAGPASFSGAEVAVRPTQLLEPGEYSLLACVDNACNGSAGPLSTLANVSFVVPSPVCTLPLFPRPDGFACEPLVRGPAPCRSQCQNPPGICAKSCDTSAQCDNPLIEVCSGTGGVCVVPCPNDDPQLDCPLPIGLSPADVSVVCRSFGSDTPFQSVCFYTCAGDQPPLSYINYAGRALVMSTGIFLFCAFVFLSLLLCAVFRRDHRRRPTTETQKNE